MKELKVLEDFKIGMRVQVSNGKKRPPKHHTRKVEVWLRENYVGTVTDVQPPLRPSFPNTVTILRTANDIFTCSHCISVPCAALSFHVEGGE